MLPDYKRVGLVKLSKRLRCVEESVFRPSVGPGRLRRRYETSTEVRGTKLVLNSYRLSRNIVTSVLS